MKDFNKMNSEEKSIYFNMRGYINKDLGDMLRAQSLELDKIKEKLVNKIDEVIDKIKEEKLEEATRYADKAKDDFKLSANLEIEEPKIFITKIEKDFLENINLVTKDNFNFVASDKNGEICLYERKPVRDFEQWILSGRSAFLRISSELFPFVKWEDEKVWSFDELLGLPVEEER